MKHVLFDRSETICTLQHFVVLILTGRSCQNNNRVFILFGSLFDQCLIQFHFFLRPGLISPANTFIKRMVLLPLEVYIH